MLHAVRSFWLGTIRSLMPTAMLNDFNEMSYSLQFEYLVSGLNNSYVREWDALYGAIAQFVWDTYRLRDEKHRSLPEF